MKALIDKILLKDSMQFNCSVSELKKQISSQKDRKFNINWISDNEFQFLSKISVGTVVVNYSPGYFNGINGYAKLKELNNGKTKIELRTKLRVEFYFIGILFIVFLLFGKDDLPIWILFMFPLMIVWFWSVYRFQEKRLFKKVKNYLNNSLSVISKD